MLMVSKGSRRTVAPCEECKRRLQLPPHACNRNRANAALGILKKRYQQGCLQNTRRVYAHGAQAVATDKRVPPQDLGHDTLCPSYGIGTSPRLETLADRLHSFGAIHLVEVFRHWFRKLVWGWSWGSDTATFRHDLCGYFRTWRRQAIAEELVPSSGDSAFLYCLQFALGIGWLDDSWCLWSPGSGGLRDLLGVFPGGLVQEFRPSAVVQDL
eukprot:4308957-Amphidinium_carterae.1